MTTNSNGKYINFDTDIMVGMSMSLFEHDLHHDLHPGYKGEERALQTFKSLSPEDKKTISESMSGESNNQIGGLINGVDLSQETQITELVKKISAEITSTKTKIDKIQKNVDKLVYDSEISRIDLNRIKFEYNLIDDKKKTLQSNILDELDKLNNHWLRLNTILELKKNKNELYEYLLNNILNSEGYDLFSSDILLNDIVRELNPTGIKKLYVSDQMTRTGLGYFVFLLYDTINDSVIFLNNEIITTANYEKKYLSQKIITYSFYSNLLNMKVVLKVSFGDQDTPQLALYSEDNQKETLLTTFINPSVKALFQKDNTYKSLLENQTVFCNYLLNIQNTINKDINKNINMKGGKTVSQVNKISKNTKGTRVKHTKGTQIKKRYTIKRKLPLNDSFSLFSDVKQTGDLYLKWLKTSKSGSRGASKEFNTIDITKSIGEDNSKYTKENIRELLNENNYKKNELKSDTTFDSTYINDKSKFCILLNNILEVLKTNDNTSDNTPDNTPDNTSDNTPDNTSDNTPDNTSDNTPDNTSDNTSDNTLSKLLKIFEDAKEKQRQPIFEQDNTNYNEEVKLRKLLSTLQLVVYIFVTNKTNNQVFTITQINNFVKFITTQIHTFKTKYCQEFEEGSKNTLTGPQKLNFTFFVCIASGCFRYGLNKLIEKLAKQQTILKKNMTINMYNMMAKTMTLKQINKMSPGKPLDDEAWKNIVNYIKEGKSDFQGKSNYLIQTDKSIGKDSSFLKELENNKNKDVALTNIYNVFEKAIKNNDRFYIPNGVITAERMGELQNNHMCNIAAIMDAQTFCSTSLSSLNKEGLEWGEFKVNISDGNSLSGSNMNYRIEVKPILNKKNLPIKAEIKVYYQIGDLQLINFGDSPISGKSNEKSLEVSLVGGSSPLKAVECFKELGTTCMKIASSKYNNSLSNFLNSVMTNDDNDINSIRQQVCNKSVRKSLGDVIIELTGVTDNGGYIETPVKTLGAQILQPNNGRLTLANDKPSGGRSLMYILYGKSGINPNCMGGFINHKGGFGVAYRGQPQNKRPLSPKQSQQNKKIKTGGKSKTRKTRKT